MSQISAATGQQLRILIVEQIVTGHLIRCTCGRFPQLRLGQLMIVCAINLESVQLSRLSSLRKLHTIVLFSLDFAQQIPKVRYPQAIEALKRDQRSSLLVPLGRREPPVTMTGAQSLFLPRRVED